MSRAVPAAPPGAAACSSGTSAITRPTATATQSTAWRSPTRSTARRAVTAEVLSFSYPDGKSHDAETLLVHPITGAIPLVTKVKEDSAGLDELATPPVAGQPAVFVEVGSVAAPIGNPRFTGGDVHSEGRGVLLRTHSEVFFYAMTPDQTVAQALASVPCALPLAEEDQGESIAWVPGGSDYITISEGVESPLGRVSCQLP